MERTGRPVTSVVHAAWARAALAVVLLATAAVGGTAAAVQLPSADGGDSLDIKIGQMLMVGFRGLRAVDADAPIVRDIDRIGIGGVILFDYDTEQRSATRNIQSLAQVRALVSDLQRQARIPLLVAIDQEGGRVARIKPKHGAAPTRSAAELGGGDPADTRAQALRTGEMLASLGISVNFAPVVDLNTNPDNPVIGRLGRSFGATTDKVVAHARAVVEGLRAHGVFSVLKHFPGHGSSRNDSHEGFTDVSGTWNRRELEPFAALIREGAADMIMTAHIFNSRLDPHHPATLSAPALSLLRDTLRWDGIIVSDDMQMRAITDQYGLEQAVALALDAGVDVLLFGNNAGTFDEDIAVKAAGVIRGLVRRGAVTPARIDASYQRILAVKSRLRTQVR